MSWEVFAESIDSLFPEFRLLKVLLQIVESGNKRCVNSVKDVFFLRKVMLGEYLLRR